LPCLEGPQEFTVTGLNGCFSGSALAGLTFYGKDL